MITFWTSDCRFICSTHSHSINSQFSNNPGTLEDFNYPVNRTQALEVLSEFFIEKFRMYGDLQDAIVSAKPFLAP